MKQKLFLITGVILIIVGGFLFWRRQVLLQEIEPLEIVFSPKWVNQAQFAGVFAAIEKGIYKKYGLDVKIKEFNFGSSVLADLKSGQSQLGLMSANEVLVNFSKGENIRAVAAFYQTSPFSVVSLKSLGITSPYDLKNKKLGIKGGPGAEGESIYSLLFKSAGLAEDRKNFVYLPFGTHEYEDLQNEKADAIGLYRTDQLFYFDKNNTPYNLISPERYGSAVYNDVLVSTPEFLQNHPKAVKNFIQATKEGWQYAFSHENEALNITQKYITQESYKDPKLEKYIFEHSKPLIMPDSVSKIGQMDISRWKEYYNILQNIKVLEKDFDITEVIIPVNIK